MSYSKDDDSNAKSGLMKDRFGKSLTSQLEEEFKRSTVGLVSKDEYKMRLKSIYDANEQQRLMPNSTKKHNKKDSTKDSGQQKSKKALLSFEDDEEGAEPEIQKKRNISKNPNVDTSFLPDREREEKFVEMKKKMSEAFMQQQEKVKEQLFDVKYMLWNGLNDVKTQRIRKNTPVGCFLELAKKELDKEHADMKQIIVENLMLVIDEQIIPFGYTFYELLASKVKSERGVLITDKLKDGETEIYEQTSKPVKIVDRRVYEKQKHIFPCSTWKIFDFSTANE